MVMIIIRFSTVDYVLFKQIDAEALSYPCSPVRISYIPQGHMLLEDTECNEYGGQLHK
jgi:hypothetical protein